MNTELVQSVQLKRTGLMTRRMTRSVKIHPYIMK